MKNEPLPDLRGKRRCIINLGIKLLQETHLARCYDEGLCFSIHRATALMCEKEDSWVEREYIRDQYAKYRSHFTESLEKTGDMQAYLKLHGLPCDMDTAYMARGAWLDRLIEHATEFCRTLPD